MRTRVVRPDSEAADRLGRDDAEYWKALSPEERFLLALQLSIEQ